MKKFKLLTAALTCFILFSQVSCRKEKDNKDTLPPETHEGLNTIGCLVNKELFRESGMFTFSIENPDTKFSNNALSITALHSGAGSNQTISLGLTNFKGTGKYSAKASFINIKYNVAAYGDDYCRYLIDSIDNTRFINITYYDSIKKIVSGTFAFKFKLSFSSPVSSTCDSVVYVTDGRFDLTFYNWN